jgi:outer membrane protein assembly factor BamB
VLWRFNSPGAIKASPSYYDGRVFAARDDGTVYAFDQRSGKIDWFFMTDDCIYGSPAVAQVPGTPPTVYIGSSSSFKTREALGIDVHHPPPPAAV